MPGCLLCSRWVVVAALLVLVHQAHPAHAVLTVSMYTGGGCSGTPKGPWTAAQSGSCYTFGYTLPTCPFLCTKYYLSFVPVCDVTTGLVTTTVSNQGTSATVCPASAVRVSGDSSTCSSWVTGNLFFYSDVSVQVTGCPDPCAAHTSCPACASAPNCGWCGGTSKCVYGSSTGPRSDQCAQNWSTSPSMCSAAVPTPSPTPSPAPLSGSGTLTLFRDGYCLLAPLASTVSRVSPNTCTRLSYNLGLSASSFVVTCAAAGTGGHSLSFWSGSGCAGTPDGTALVAQLSGFGCPPGPAPTPLPSAGDVYSQLCALVQANLPSACTATDACTRVTCAYTIPPPLSLTSRVGMVLDVCAADPALRVSVNVSEPVNLYRDLTIVANLNQLVTVPGLGVSIPGIASVQVNLEFMYTPSGPVRNLSMSVDVCGNVSFLGEVCGSDLADVPGLQFLAPNAPLTVLAGQLDTTALCVTAPKSGVAAEVVGPAVGAGVGVAAAAAVCIAVSLHRRRRGRLGARKKLPKATVTLVSMARGGVEVANPIHEW